MHKLGVVEEYIESFELIYTQVPRLTEPQYLGYFVGGLHLDIRQKVHSFHLENCGRAMQVARDMERKLRGVVQTTEVTAYRARMNQPGAGQYVGCQA